jgi:hypothetical protein
VKVWLTFRRSDLLRSINNADSVAVSAALRVSGGSGQHGVEGSLKWDALGDPYSSGKTLVLCFATELDARAWAEALAFVNVQALKTTKPRKLKLQEKVVPLVRERVERSGSFDERGLDDRSFDGRGSIDGRSFDRCGVTLSFPILVPLLTT